MQDIVKLKRTLSEIGANYTESFADKIQTITVTPSGAIFNFSVSGKILNQGK